VLKELYLDRRANVHQLRFGFNRQLNAVVDFVLSDDELLRWILEPHIGMVVFQLNAMAERLLDFSILQTEVAPASPQIAVAQFIGIALQVVGFGFSVPQEAALLLSLKLLE
jgi:hypothetical protein